MKRKLSPEKEADTSRDNQKVSRNEHNSAIINPSIAVNNFQNTFLSYFYTPLIDKYTREDKKRGTSTLLDNIYTNLTQTPNSIQSGILKTDHYSIFGIIDLMMNTHKTEYVTKHEYSEKKLSKFHKYLDKFNWDNVLSNNFQASFSSFQSNFSIIFNTSLKKKKKRYKNRLPYITKALQQSIKTKHLLNFAYKKNPTETNKLKSTTFNNKLTSLLRNREKDYIEE